MIKYLLPERSRVLIKVDTENLDTVNTLNNHNLNIDWMWIVDEDGEFNNKPVHKGDIIISFYNMPNKTDSKEIIIIDDNNLKDYYRRYDEAYKEYENSMKEKNSKCCDCCECSDVHPAA